MLAVDEVGDAAEEQADRHRRAAQVEDRARGDFELPARTIPVAAADAIKAPWNAMPPFQTAMISCGLAK